MFVYSFKLIEINNDHYINKEDGPRDRPDAYFKTPKFRKRKVLSINNAVLSDCQAFK